MFVDAASVVRVTQFYKTITAPDAVTKLPVTYRVPLDWGIGVVDHGYNGVYTYGSPYQLFSNGDNGIYGDPLVDTRVHVVPEPMTFSTLSGGAVEVNADTVHFKHPNI